MDTGASAQAHAAYNPDLIRKATTFLDYDVTKLVGLSGRTTRNTGPRTDNEKPDHLETGGCAQALCCSRPSAILYIK